MSDARKKLIETVAATISGDLSSRLDVLEKDIERRNMVVNELEKHEADARGRLEKLYAEIAQADLTLKQATSEAESTKSTAHGHADRLRAEGKGEARETIAEATKQAERITADARKARDAFSNEVTAKKTELKNVQAAVDAAKTELATMKQHARKFADG